ncbi:MAG: dihydroorotate dehydrogenase [Phycisphaerales bacterium]|nr:dihydroorotate dehydrogenase [Phycisphaerales bacterium]
MAADASILHVDLAGLTLANPVIAAAGTAGYADELAGVAKLARLGAVVTKSITQAPRAGNETWRIVPITGGMMNAIGLANMGLDRFLEEVVPRIERLDIPVIGSVAGGSIDEYTRVAQAMDAAGVLPAIELNVSCPNTDDGRQFGGSPELLSELVREVKDVVQRAVLFVKLPPSTEGISTLAAAAIKGGADVLTICNTIPGLALDPATGKPRIARGVAGVSGPAIHPLAVRLVHEVYRDVAADAGVPIVGTGGVMAWRDAAEFILAGATAVGMGTALFADPRSPLRVIADLRRWAHRRGAARITDLVGTAAL